MLFISFLWFSLVLTTSGFRQFPDRLKGCRKGISCLMKKKTNRFQPQDTTPSTRPVVKSVPDPGVGNAYEIELPKLAGIDWGADLSFRWVKVIGLDPSGEAFKSNLVKVGDYVIGVGNTSTIAKDFDYVISSVNACPESRLNYTFFRGTKRQLVGDDTDLILDPGAISVKITVQQEGKKDIILECPGGTNLRNLLVSNGINVYRSLTRWTNCNGQQRCGTCIVDIKDGINLCSRKSLGEDMVLAENDPTYRLSCVTAVYGDVTVVVQGAVGAAQWTR